MMGFSFSSLRARLLLLVLLAVIPALGLILYTAAEQRRSAALEAQANALRLARSVSSSQDDLIEGARQLLTALAQVPMVRGDNPAECNSLFSVLVKKYAGYTNLGVVTPAGNIFCSGLPLPGPVNVADRAWFRRALESRDLVIGDYIVGRVTGKATLGLGYPVLDEAGAVRAVLYAGLDLGWLNKIAAKTQLPTGTTLTVVDRKGTVLVRFPDSEKWVGKSMLETPLFQTILRQGEGTAELPGMDGLLRLYGFSSLGNARDAYVSIGIPRDVAFAPANRILIRNLMGVGIVGALALLAAWFGSDLFVLRQVNALTKATKRLGDGELSVRTGLPYGKGELSDLARTFDQMAASMEQLVSERQQAEQRLASLHEINTAITSTLDLHAMLNLLMEKIDIFLPRTAIQVWLLNKEKDFLERTVCWNLDEAEWKGREMERIPPLVQEAFEGRMPVTVMNIQTDPRVLDPQFFRKHGLLSYLGVPMLVKDEPIGVLIFHTRELHEFAKEEIRFFSTLAGQAAIAIHNSLLYEQTKKQTVELEGANRDLKRQEEIQELLKELSQDITSLDIDSLLRKLTVKVREFLKVDVADVRVLEGEHWYLRGVSGMDSSAAAAVRPGTAQRRTGWILRNRRPLVVSDITRSQRMRADGTTEGLGIRGFLGVPIFSRGGEVIGILRALSYQPREFTQEEVDLLQQLANGAGLALENAQLLEQIRKQAVELEKANKMQADFTAMIAHDLRSPLTAVLSAAAFLKDGLVGPVNEEQHSWLDKIETHSRNLATFVNDFLDLAKIESGHIELAKEEVDLDRLIRNSLDNYLPLTRGKKICVTRQVEPALPRIHADPRRLDQVLSNLLSNAIKFTGEGGKIEVGAGRENGTEVRLWVKNDGAGISATEIGTLFDMYRQTASGKGSKEKGTGLGLAICKMIVEAHGGKIWVESEEGKGTTFLFTLPA